MDKSETFIKMCEKAKEIQEIWIPKDGDFYAEKYKDEHFNYHYTSPQILTGFIYRERFIWLPCQDQLQIMIEQSPLDYIDGIKGFWLDSNFPDCSWEQLWLGCVMEEKYNKTWDLKKEDWIISKDLGGQ